MSDTGTTTPLRYVRGWNRRENYSAGDDVYQMSCGHYQKKGVYACNDCNLAPLSDLNTLIKTLSEVCDWIERRYEGAPEVCQNARRILEEID